MSPLFRWPQFLTSHGVAYVTRGPNTGKDSLSVRCPWCGASDPSEHLSISLKGAGYRCFRNPRAHSGRSRSRLIQALLRCSLEEAQRLAGDGETPATPPDADFAVQIAGMLGEDRPGASPPKLLSFPREFKLLKRGYFANKFWDYLQDRGYSVDDSLWLAKEYDLHYAARGPYAYRLIIPIYTTEGRLATWTARSILPDAEVRYKTLSKTNRYGPEEAVALLGPTELLLGLPLLLKVPNPEVLVLCEGPFDAMRISVLGRGYGVYGTCLFGLNISEVQATLLDRLMTRFRRLVLLLDPDAQMLSLRIKEFLTPLSVYPGRLPEGIEDPGALPYAGGKELVQSWL